MTKLATAVATVAFVALASLAHGGMGDDMSGPGMGPGMMCGGGMDEQMMDGPHPMMFHRLMALNLDDKQKATIGEIKRTVMKEAVRRSADMRIAQIDLKYLVDTDPVDMAAVEAKVKQLETIRTEMQLSHIKAMEACKDALTPEQRKQLKETVGGGPMMKRMEMKHDMDGEMMYDMDRGMKRK